MQMQVPMDKPKPSLELISAFTQGKLLTSAKNIDDMAEGRGMRYLTKPS